MPEARKLIVPEFARSERGAGDSPIPGIQSRFATKVFSSFLSMVVLIPGLMLLAGGGLVLMGQSGLRQATETALRQRVTDETVNVARATTDCLDQAKPLLAALREGVLADNGRDPVVFATRVRTLLQHRPGVANLGFAGADGSRMEVAIESDQYGLETRLHQWQIETDGTTTLRVSDIAPANGYLTTIETTRDTGYDARKRPYFPPTLTTTAPVWTDPYEFVSPKVPGITCAQAVRDRATGALIGVVTVDFDLSTLSQLMDRLAQDGAPGEVAFLFAGNSTLLATSGSLADLVQRAGRIKAVETVSHDLPAAGEIRFVDLAQAGLPLLLGVRGIQIADGPVWYAGIRVHREALNADAAAQVNRTLVVAIAGLAVAVGLSVLLANHLARQRRITTAARAAVTSAQEKLQAMGSYTLIQELGAGGMGAVWRAEHHLLARPAALKLIRMDVVANSELQRKEARGRFEREAKATASLRSRNTITLYDYGSSADGSFYYAMELLDGLDLNQLVFDFGPQPVGRVVGILIQACSSLAEAHARAMVHRDIKPANIYLCRLGIEVDVVKVLDFGLVAERTPGSEQLSQVGMVYGTPAFMAPEQAQGARLDGRADLYAIGCVAYWLLSGRMVFDKPDAMAVMVAHIHDPPRPLSSVARQAIPPALNDLIMALLAKSPGDRPRDAAAVIAVLRELDLTPEQTWTPMQAESWWNTHRPPAGTSRVAVPNRGDAATVIQPATG